MKGAVCVFSFLWWLVETAIRGGIRIEGHRAAHRENQAGTCERGRIFNSP